MIEMDWLVGRFEDNRSHLWAVAYRILGSTADAEGALQETWVRLSGSDATEIANLSGWLTTVVARICLNMLRSRQARREEVIDAHVAAPAEGHDPEEEALLADSLGLALLVVLEQLSPSERIAFVLHDVFSLPFDEIAPIIDRSSAATRQLASRARRRVRGAPVPDSGADHQRAVVDAFLSAARNGDFAALLALLDPDVVLSTDRAAAAMGAPSELRGAQDVASMFSGRALAAQRALIDGRPGAIWAPGGRVRVAFDFAVDGARITRIHMIADTNTFAELKLEALDT